jgi:hypothetical protein
MKQLAAADQLRPAACRHQNRLERFQAKACPGLDPGWKPVRVKKTRHQESRAPFDSIETEKALGGFAAASDFPAIDLSIALERDGVLFGFDRRALAATGSRLDWSRGPGVTSVTAPSDPV